MTLTLTLKLKIAFWLCCHRGHTVMFHNHPLDCLYARLYPLDFSYAVIRRVVLWYGNVRPGLRPSDSPSVRVSVRPGLRPPVFSHFYPFDILSWNFAHDFVLMYCWSRSSIVSLRQFFKELCLFVNSEYRKFAVFRTFLLHALTYWAEILHMTLFWWITDQVRVSSICVNLPLYELRI